MYCAMCGAKVDLASKFCSNCGFSLGTDASQANSQTLQTQFVPVSTTTERRRTLFGRFFWGELGLARTFWIGGILVASILFFVITFSEFSHISKFAFALELFILCYMPIFLIATWSAADKYHGKKIWVWLAKLTVVGLVLVYIFLFLVLLIFSSL